MRKSFLFAVIILGFISMPLVSDDGWGSLKGSIVVDGAAPEISKEKIDKDQASCLSGKPAPDDDNLLVGPGGELKDAFVMMYRKGTDPTPAIHPSYADAKKQPVVLDNKNCRFVPHAIFLQTGQPLEMRNSDDVGHNCHIITFNNEENINLATKDSVQVTFTDADKTPGNVVCDIHNWMDAVILVRDEPYAAISKADGTFEIKNIPAGTWKFQFWHKKTGFMKKLDVPNYKVGKIKADIEVTIKDGETLDLGKLTLPASSIKKK